MHKWNMRHTCVLLFLLLCAAAFAYLQAYTEPQCSIQYVTWESSVRINPDGTEEAIEIKEFAPPDASDAGMFRFCAHLPEDVSGGYLMFEVSGLDIVLSLGETEIYRSSSVLDENIVGMAQIHIPLSDDAAGRELRAVCRQLGENGIFPPLVRFASDISQEADVIAYANIQGISSGAYALAFVLVFGLFLLGVVWKKADLSLLPLSFAAFLLTLVPIASTCGYYFLPEWLWKALIWRGFEPLTFLSLAAYLVMNRRRNFWKLFGKAALWSGVGFLAAYLVSLYRGGYLASYTNEIVSAIFEYGDCTNVVRWLTLWLVIICALISAYSLMRSIAAVQSEANALAMREKLAMDSYRQMEQKLRDTYAVRHEMNHKLAALDALYRSGDMDGLGDELSRLTKASGKGQPLKYSVNFTIDAILQNAASQAASAGIRFDAIALAPERLEIAESDLCSFMMNMLDNALEANLAVDDAARRFISFRVELSDSFLVFRCENAYSGTLKLDSEGYPLTTKRDAELHGFGMRQMRGVAKKYGSMLDFSHTGETVTVRSALCLK